MKRRDFLKLLGIGGASVALGLPKLAAELTASQADAPVAVGDIFSVYMGHYGLGATEGGATIPMSYRKVYRVKALEGDYAVVDCTNWFQHAEGEEGMEAAPDRIMVALLDNARKPALNQSRETVLKAQ